MRSIAIFMLSFVLIGVDAAAIPGKKQIKLRLRTSPDTLRDIELAGMVEVADGVFCLGQIDSTRIYLAFFSEHAAVRRSLSEIGVRLQIKAPGIQDFSVRFVPLESGSRLRPLPTAMSGIEPLLPKTIIERLRDYTPRGQYAAYYLPQDRRFGAQLAVTDFDALYREESGIFVAQIPLRSPVYAGGALQFDKKRRLEIKVEIGDDSPFTQFMRTTSGFSSGAARNAPPLASGTYDEQYRPAFEKFTVEVLLPAGFSMPEASTQADKLALSVYLTLLEDWSVSSFQSRDGGFPGGRGGSTGTIIPISVQGLFVSPPIIQAGIAYFSAYLNLTPEERAQIRRDFRRQWLTESLFPVLLTLRTNLHESYLDLRRWTIFIQDDQRNQYEARQVQELPNPALNAGAIEGEERGIRRPAMVRRVKRVLMHFPIADYEGKPLFTDQGRRLKFIVISNENLEQRLEMEWRVPKWHEPRK